ncbi:GOLPH3/VPS74 family protein, partial [Micromonospora echinospora]
LMLLLMDDDGVSIQTAGTLHDALGGAVLTELALLGRIQTDNSGVLDGPRVTPAGEGPLPDPLLQSAYDTVAEKTQRVRPLLVALGTDLWWVVLDRLVDRGLLHREATQLRARIRRVLADGEAADPRTAAIIGLLFASGAVPSLRPPLPWTSTTVTRASEIGRGHWGSQALTTAVTRTAAAIVAATAACQPGDHDEVSAQVDPDDPRLHAAGVHRPSFTDRAGPDASAIIRDFAQRHPEGAPA